MQHSRRADGLTLLTPTIFNGSLTARTASVVGRKEIREQLDRSSNLGDLLSAGAPDGDRHSAFDEGTDIFALNGFTTVDGGASFPLPAGDLPLQSVTY